MRARCALRRAARCGDVRTCTLIIREDVARRLAAAVVQFFDKRNLRLMSAGPIAHLFVAGDESKQ